MLRKNFVSAKVLPDSKIIIIIIIMHAQYGGDQDRDGKIDHLCFNLS